jgi:hypothetical protein
MGICFVLPRSMDATESPLALPPSGKSLKDENRRVVPFPSRPATRNTLKWVSRFSARYSLAYPAPNIADRFDDSRITRKTSQLIVCL